MKSYQSYESGNQIFSIAQEFPNEIPDLYKKDQYESFRHEFGCYLIDIIERFKSPCVIEIFERKKPTTSYYGNGEEIILSVRLTNVHHREIEFIHTPIVPINSDVWKEFGLFDRIKWIVTGKTK